MKGRITQVFGDNSASVLQAGVQCYQQGKKQKNSIFLNFP